MSKNGKISVSFGFKNKIQTKVDADKVIKENDSNVPVDYLSQVDAESLNAASKPKKELVIPLIKQNRWKKKETNQPSQDKNNFIVEDEAAQEIMKESAQYLEKLEEVNDQEKQFVDLAVPLLLKNKVPDGFESDDKLDVSIRPDQASLDDYEDIPIEAFGMAMLRGMGWDPKVGIGRTFKQNTKVLEANLRPRGLGLGAEATNKQKSKTAVDNDSKKEEVLEIRVGAFVLVESGSHKRKYGVIEGLDADNAQCIVKLTLDNKSSTIGQYALKVVSKAEFTKYSKDLSRLSKQHQTQENLKNGHGSDQLNDKKAKKRRHRDADYREKNSPEYRSGKKKQKHRYEDRKPSRYDSTESKSPKNRRKNNQKTWLKPNLKVRMIDQHYRKGKYYREKLFVVDVFDLDGNCSCKTSSGTLLDDVNENMLETVVPRSSSDAYVVITSHGRLKHDGKLAKILEKDKDNCQAYLQLLDDRDIAVKAGFDEICEYSGNIEEDLMF